MNKLVAAARKKRLQQGLTFRALSKLIGVSFSALARLERGTGSPDVHTVERLKRWLDDDCGSAPKVRSDQEKGWFAKMDARVTRLEALFTPEFKADLDWIATIPPLAFLEYPETVHVVQDKARRLAVIVGQAREHQ